MSPFVVIIMAVLVSFIIIVAALWMIVPLVNGLPWVPTQDQRIRKALLLANVQPGELVFDLGAGDGRVLITAVREFKAHAVGIEISPIHCLIALARIRMSNVSDRASIRCGNFYKFDFSSADVVFIYATSRHANRLIPLLEKQLKNGARVVTISSSLDAWQPERIDREDLVFLYRIPPVKGEPGLCLIEAASV